MTVKVKLPDSEFKVMTAVWACKGKISCNEVTALMKEKWKAQAVLSLLGRLVEKGFLRTEKHGKERIYFPLINQEEYLQFETENLISRIHGNSFASFFSTLCKGRSIDDEDIQKLLNMIDNKK